MCEQKCKLIFGGGLTVGKHLQGHTGKQKSREGFMCVNNHHQLVLDNPPSLDDCKHSIRSKRMAPLQGIA